LHRHYVGAEHTNNVNVEATVMLEVLDDVGAAGDFLEQLKDRARPELMQMHCEAGETDFGNPTNRGSSRPSGQLAAATPRALYLSTEGSRC
jgi:hypothetical protein